MTNNHFTSKILIVIVLAKFLPQSSAYSHGRLTAAAQDTRTMVYSKYKKQRILHYYFQGFRGPAIWRLLEEEKLHTTRESIAKFCCVAKMPGSGPLSKEMKAFVEAREGIAKFVKKYQETGCVARRPGSRPPSKVTVEMKVFVEAKMREDDETTAH